MGTYLNPGSDNFQRGICSEIYVDKTGLLEYTNRRINTQQCYLCVSRPRRFGKSMAADMLAAYYGCGSETRDLFEGMKIAATPEFGEQLNQYYVIKLDMQMFMTDTSSVYDMIRKINKDLIQELITEFPEVPYLNRSELPRVIDSIYQSKNRRFVILLDEFSMVRSLQLVPYFGFTETEVKSLCERYAMNFEEAREWYDGYHFAKGRGEQRVTYSMYSPKSVVDAMLNEEFDTYWTQTESYEALRDLIQMNFDGLQDDITEMLAGNSVSVNTRSFQNDMSVFHGKDDVLTLLIHLGYLSYNSEEKSVCIPNKEVAEEFISSIANTEYYGEVYKSVQDSKSLLKALWEMDEKTVADGVEKVHMQFPSIHYNGENALSCVIELAFYYAREYYTVFRELSTGVGFADICFLPKPYHKDKPAVIIELKWNKNVKGAIDQIKDRKYPHGLDAYQGKMLLCGISYEKSGNDSKKHTCKMEKFVKE